MQYLDNIPKEILQRVFTSDDEFRNYTLATQNYGNESFDVAGQFIDDLQPGHSKHHESFVFWKFNN